ncbi:AAA family ATPase [Tessaracoccus sp. OS52]|uniref:AAA family ATPase n=1 Tax=Tessaracoccus sp. OS52 TaxID=2886691 RepID=UPI001D0F8F88|nr:AAA family ATPase [Tessaracoccus sp. OS52]MCC2593892.1 AAA family ATPase [Tessaracoccus sp. OS52]
MRLQRPAEPAILAQARPRLEAELERAWQSKRKRGPEADPLLNHSEVVSALLAMTQGTCAYCERSVPASGPDSVVVTHHRPTWGAVGQAGEVDQEAYRWFTYDWENLYPACADCVRSRGTRFPVAGTRARNRSEIISEHPLLLDPVVDDPDQHLRYSADGTVVAMTDRGLTTSDVLALNRDALVRARAAVAEHLASPDADVDAMGFATLRRQLAESLPGAAPPPGAPPAPTPSPPLPAGPPLPRMVGAEPGSQGYDLTGPMGPAEKHNYFNAAQWIERVVIDNFRPIRELDLDLSRSTSERGPWTVLLGENGSGKSSVLHAIALTMMGGEQRRALGINASTYLRHGAPCGRVQVFLSGRTEPLELTWGRGDVHFKGPEAVTALLLGYGATRLLPPRGAVMPIDQRVVRVDNLFDPLRPLTDPTAWLLSLDEDTFADVAEGIHELLALGVDDELVRAAGVVQLRQGRNRSDIRALSDGYQSMVVMSCDILRSVLGMWTQPALAEGIVLIDELGAHLHPRWRMRIVTAVRNLMPRVQFVVTTHDPLCLRGLVDGEVVVVRRNSEGDVVAMTDLPPVSGMRIDQLLTSEHFGLGSTDDPEVTDLWEKYYSIKGMRSPSAEQLAELDRVRTRLDELEQLGTTERDRLVLDSAAEYIAHRREVGDAVAPTNDEVTRKLSELWDKHLPGGV